uniref:Expressed conserved protein n=2 Tax=Echinococcus granulosus TaxID=6210 RepID=A0A068WX20_ECHGR|nr:expressed conserved protein [Echinococcus granulosus]
MARRPAHPESSYFASPEMLLPYVKKFEAYMKSGTRHPAFPWSLTSRIRQFPYAWYYQNNKFVRYYALCMPVFLPLCVYLLIKFHFVKKKLTHNYDPFNPYEIPASKLGHY